MSWIPVAGFILLLAGFIYELYTGSIRSRFYKPNLEFDVKSCSHWNDYENNQSGISLTMFITNKGNKVTTIRDIRIGNIHSKKDFWTVFNIRFGELEIGPEKDKKYSRTFMFNNLLLEDEKLVIDLIIEHTEKTETIEGIKSYKRN